MVWSHKLEAPVILFVGSVLVLLLDLWALCSSSYSVMSHWQASSTALTLSPWDSTILSYPILSYPILSYPIMLLVSISMRTVLESTISHHLIVVGICHYNKPNNSYSTLILHYLLLSMLLLTSSCSASPVTIIIQCCDKSCICRLWDARKRDEAQSMGTFTSDKDNNWVSQVINWEDVNRRNASILLTLPFICYLLRR